MTRPAPAPRRRILGGALLGLALAALLLAVAEAGTRVVLRLRAEAWPQTRLAAFYRDLGAALALYRLHPYLNTAPRAGVRVEAFGKSAGFNSLGYRSPERPLAKPPGVMRVLCAGGSTTFDLAAASDAESWPWRLEEGLRAAGLAVEVWNAGFPGWTSLENLIALAARDLDLEPDVVLLFQGINDLQPAAHVPFDPQYERGHAEVVRRALGFELPPLAWHQRLLVFERLRDAIRGPRSPMDPWRLVAAGRANGPRLSRLPPEAIAAFGRNVRSLVAVSRAAGAQPVLVSQPIRLRRDHLASDRRYLEEWLPGLLPEAAPTQLERLNQEMRAVASRHEAGWLDVAARVDWEDEDFADPLHVSACGSAKLAEFLASALLQSRHDGQAPLAPVPR